MHRCYRGFGCCVAAFAPFQMGSYRMVASPRKRFYSQARIMLLLFVMVVLRVCYRRVYLDKFCYLWSVPRGTFIYTCISKPVDAQTIMSIIKIGKHTVEIYDDIESLPVVRYHKYSKMRRAPCGRVD